MGTKMAVAFANILIARIEDQILSQSCIERHVLVATTRREEMLHLRRSAHASRVCSSHAQTTFEETINDFENRQVKRGYPVPIARKYLSELKFADRKTAFQLSNKSASKKTLPFVTK